MDIPVLWSGVQGYYFNGIASSTLQAYNTGQTRYLKFCKHINTPPLPTSETTLLLFSAYLAQQPLAYTTIKVYLSTVRHLHTTLGFHSVYAEQVTPRLQLVLKGIKKKQLHSESPRERLPITTAIMTRIHNIFARTPNDYHSIMMWAACNLAFFGFLRCGEFTIPCEGDFDPEVHLTINDIAIDDHIMPSTVRVRIKQSKTDPFREGISLFLGKTDHTIYPIKGILPYLAIRGKKLGPLFLTKDNKPLTRQKFHSTLAVVLQQVGLDNKKYNTHSFRIGAATSARQAGIPDAPIQMLGRWQSSAYKQYIKTPQEDLASLSKQLISSKK